MTDFQLEEQWHQTVEFAEQTAIDARGTPQFGAVQTDTPVRIEPMIAVVYAGTSRERKTSHRILTNRKYLDTDRIWLPDFASATSFYRHPAKIGEFFDEFGNVDHYEVWV